MMATLYGVFVILLPERLGVALEPANRSLVTGYGALLVAVGLPLLFLHPSAPRRRPPWRARYTCCLPWG